jgi:hypothetical protein
MAKSSSIGCASIWILMCKPLVPIPIALLFAALLFYGCAREPNPAAALRVAVLRSNQEAKRLFRIEPFKEENGHWRVEGQQSIWDALTSSGGHDILAAVRFDQKGRVASVDVRMITHPSSVTSTNSDLLLDPDMHRERRLGIPEVMPK